MDAGDHALHASGGGRGRGGSRRLDAAASLVTKAAENRPGTPKAVKQVHALRVATRRAAATLDVFESVVPKKAAAKLRKRLRTIRRTAGTARDLDVQVELVSGGGPCRDGRFQGAALKGLGAPDSERCARCPGPPGRSLPKNGHRESSGAIGEILLGGSRPRTGSSSARRARRTVGKAIERVEAAAREDLRVVDNVHNLRRKLKRLRYAMEEVGVCFGELWKKMFQPRLVAAQRAIGEINDAHVLLVRLLEESAPQSSKGGKRRDASGGGERKPATAKRGIGPLVRAQSDVLARSHAAFLDQWQALERGGFFADMRRELGLKLDEAGPERQGGREPEPGVPTVPTRILRPIGLIEPKDSALEDAAASGPRSNGTCTRRPRDQHAWHACRAAGGGSPRSTWARTASG